MSSSWTSAEHSLTRGVITYGEYRRHSWGPLAYPAATSPVALFGRGVRWAIMAAISLGSPVHYTSEALLEVEAHTPLTRELNPSILSTAPDQVRTEADILKSRALAASVVRELDLSHAPDFVAAPRPPRGSIRSPFGRRPRTGIQELLGQPDDSDNSIDDAVSLFRKRLLVIVNDKSHIVDCALPDRIARIVGQGDPDPVDDISVESG